MECNKRGEIIAGAGLGIFILRMIKKKQKRFCFTWKGKIYEIKETKNLQGKKNE